MDVLVGMDFLNSLESTGGGGLPEGEDDHEDEGGGPVFENPYTCGDQILWPFDTQAADREAILVFFLNFSLLLLY